VIFNVANSQVFNEAFVQNPTVGVIGSVSSAATSNVVMDASFNVTLWPSTRVTDNTFCVFNTDGEHRSIFETERAAMDVMQQTKANSDRARTLDIEGVYAEKRAGYGVSLPINTCRVTN